MNAIAEEKIENCIRAKSKYLNLSNSSLESLKLPIERLIGIKSINLSDNNFENFPNELLKLKSLNSIFLTRNYLQVISESITSLKTLATIDLSSNKFDTFPYAIINLANLNRLDISNNNISNIPDNISKLKNLEMLNLAQNNIFELPETIGYLQKLNTLILRNNCLKYLPESFTDLLLLESLDLQFNQIYTLPNRIDEMKALKFINLQNNILVEIPETIGNLSNLHFIDLSHNRLYKLPVSLRQMQDLEYLNIGNNQIEYAQDAISMLPTQTIKLELRGNPFLDKSNVDSHSFIKIWNGVPYHLRELLVIYFSGFKLFFLGKTGREIAFDVSNQNDGLSFQIKFDSESDVDQIEKLLNIYFETLKDKVRSGAMYGEIYPTSTADNADYMMQIQAINFTNNVVHIRNNIEKYLTKQEAFVSVNARLYEMEVEFKSSLKEKLVLNRQLTEYKENNVRLLERANNQKEELKYRREESNVRASQSMTFNISQQISISQQIGNDFYRLQELLDDHLSSFQKVKAREIEVEIEKVNSNINVEPSQKELLATKMKRWLSSIKDTIKISKDATEVIGDIVKQFNKLSDFASNFLNDSETVNIIHDVIKRIQE